MSSNGGLLNEIEYIIVISCSLLAFILIFVVVIYYYKYTKPYQNSLFITNGMVILIGIADYKEVDNPDIDGYLSNLSGIEHDIVHMENLFYNELNYDVYPLQSLESIQHGDSPKTYWTEKELHTFLVEKAKYLEENIDEKHKYDGLIVIISSHGIARNIITSDYKKFAKLAIHRIFSSPHPKSRKIPRLFLFDSCLGNNEQKSNRLSINDNGKPIKNEDLSKQISLNNVENDGDYGESWMVGEDNPDFNLAVIEAANPGFQSKLRNDIGSYLIYFFYKKMLDILQQNKRKYIYQTFDEIQDHLHKKGKQHPTYIWNDNTRYIRFKKNNNLNRNEMEMIEMKRCDDNINKNDEQTSK
eukprot:158628_1